jgi:pimeloyl-ACP methyl ester carboxylesterase
MALELHETLTSAKIPGPYVLVGQSFGGSLVRGFANRYATSVAGMVLVDAIHEDGYVVWGGQPHHLRDEAQGRVEPKPILGLDTATIRMSRTTPGEEEQPIHPPLDRMPVVDQRIWRWAASQPVYSLVQPLEMEWSAEEAQREYQRRLVERAPLGAIPLIVLARTQGGFASGMSISADSLEKIRRAQQADLAKLSRNGELRFAPNAGHNIHVEDPGFVAQAILDVVRMVRARTHGH